MQITVELLSLFRMLSGEEHQVTMEMPGGACVRDTLRTLCERFGSAFERTLFAEGGVALADEVAVLLNGQSISLDRGLDTLLSDRDRITLLVTISGGCCSRLWSSPVL